MAPAPTVVPAKLTGADVTRAVWRHFSAQSWAGLAEVTARGPRNVHLDDDWQPGDLLPWQRPENKDRRIDLLLLRTPRKEGLGGVERLAIEVKVTRADFLSDVRTPEKQAPWRELAHRHAYAVPAGLVQPHEVPAGSGLLYISTLESGYGYRTEAVAWERRAPYTSTNPDMPSWLSVLLANRASWAEGKAKGWLAGVDDDDVEAMRGKIARLEKELGQTKDRLTGAISDRDEWRRVAGLTLDAVKVPCRTCGQPLVAKNITMRYGMGWKHADKGHDAACTLLAAGDRYHRPMPDDAFDPSAVGVDA
jgi:hypothetical protein